MYRVLVIVLCSFSINISFAQNEKLKKIEAEGDTAMNHSDFAKAIKVYSKVIKTSKLKERTDYIPLYKRAVCYFSIKDFPHTLEDLNKVIPELPALPQARMLRAITYGEMGDIEKKKKDLAEALLADPANPALLKWRASIYIEDEEFGLAKQDLSIAKLFADDPETEMYLGVAQYNSGSVDSAFQSLDKAIQLDATYMPAYMYASSFSLDQDKFQQGIELSPVRGSTRAKKHNGVLLQRHRPGRT
jgi:tetratricopeptide (TPR) repeat protein